MLWWHRQKHECQPVAVRSLNCLTETAEEHRELTGVDRTSWENRSKSRENDTNMIISTPSFNLLRALMDIRICGPGLTAWDDHMLDDAHFSLPWCRRTEKNAIVLDVSYHKVAPPAGTSRVGRILRNPAASSGALAAPG